MFDVKDMYYGNLPVSSATDLFIQRGGASSEYGGFEYGVITSTYDRNLKSLTVTLSVGIQISTLALPNSCYGSGDEAQYQNHTLWGNDAWFDDSIVYEAVYEHELAHARAFFTIEKLSILSRLYNLEAMLKDNNYSDSVIHAYVCDAINGVINSDEAAERSNRMANTATRAWFNQRGNGWIKFYDKDGLGKWRKE